MYKITNEIKQNFHDLLYSSHTWLFLLKKSATIVLIFVIAIISIRLVKIVIKHIFNLRYKATILDRNERTFKKNKTIEKLLISIGKYVIYFLSIVAILSNLGINITGLIAGAGLVSVAVGFGAQTLVKDIITGFFIALEDQFSVGDYIQIYNGSNIIAEGTVDILGLRSTKLKSKTGEEWFVPNSQIIQVRNKSLNFSTVSISLTISFVKNIEDISQQLNQYFKKLSQREDYQKILYSKNNREINPMLLGMESINDNNVTLLIVAEAMPLKNHELYRMLNKDILLFIQQGDVTLISLNSNMK